MAKPLGLMRRGATYYYRVRVPLDLVDSIGKSEIKESLKTTDYSEAKKRRNERALHWQAHFEHARKNAHQTTPSKPSLVTQENAIRLVQRYVFERDKEWRQTFAKDGPSNFEEKKELLMDYELPLQFLDDPSDPRGDELVSSASEEILKVGNLSLGQNGLSYPEFATLVERALREIYRRRSATLRNNFSETHFDFLFNPDLANAPESITFGELAEEYFSTYTKQAKVQKISQNRVERVRKSLDLANEVIGADTPVADINYDLCLAFVETLSRIPSNRRKFYPTLTLDEAIAAAEKDGKPPTSFVTQQVHLQEFNAVLKLGVKKGILSTVPSADMSPHAEKTSDAKKRRSFSLDQLQVIFKAPLYTGCKNDHIGFSKPGPNVIRRARFWVPLICLHTGMRPNEVCQLYVEDIKLSEKGTRYIDVVADKPDKKLKNERSRRKIPLHSELVKIGFLPYVDETKRNGHERLFPELKPGRYGYYSTYLSDWFSSSFLSSVMTKEKGLSLYSLRHNFRDALRFSNAPDWILQAIGGWEQGTKVSDNYGSTTWPDETKEWVEKIKYEGLDLSHLYATKQAT